MSILMGERVQLQVHLIAIILLLDIGVIETSQSFLANKMFIP